MYLKFATAKLKCSYLHIPTIYVAIPYQTTKFIFKIHQYSCNGDFLTVKFNHRQ